MSDLITLARPYPYAYAYVPYRGISYLILTIPPWVSVSGSKISMDLSTSCDLAHL